MLKALLAIIILAVLDWVAGFFPIWIQNVVGIAVILGLLGFIVYIIIKLYKSWGAKLGTLILVVSIGTLMVIFHFYNYFLNII